MKRNVQWGLWGILALNLIAWFVFVARDQGRSPKDEMVSYTSERDLTTGELFTVEVIRCKKCGQVISWVRFNRLGLPVAGKASRYHECDHVWGKKAPEYNGLAFAKGWNLGLWLDHCQNMLISSNPTKNTPENSQSLSKTY